MNALIEFKCDLCRQEIINKSISEDHMGFCKNKTNKEFSNNLLDNIDGPHICMKCITTIYNKKTEFKIN